jgi:hypothetical protein
MSRTTTLGIIAVVLAILGFVAGYYAAPKGPTATQTVTRTSTQTTTVTQTGYVTQTVTQTSTLTTTVTQTAAPSMQMPTPALAPISSSTVSVNAAEGATVRAGPIIAVIRPGTYAMVGNKTLSNYNFSIVLYSVYGLGASPDGGWPVYAFAFAVNGMVSPAVTFVDSMGKPRPIITIAYMPDNWSSWTWLGYKALSNGTLVGGRYAFVDKWYYVGGGAFVNIQFVKPVPWVFTAGPYSYMPQFATFKPPMSSAASGLVPVEIAEAAINGTIGGALRVGNIIAVIPPGTYLSDGQTMYKTYNFSLIYYATLSMPGIGGMAPFGAYAFAANGVVSAKYTFVNAAGSPSPIVTIAVLPSETTSWTWLPSGPVQQTSAIVNGTYKFANVWLYGDGYIVNVQFVKPVPWIFLGPR